MSQIFHFQTIVLFCTRRRKIQLIPQKLKLNHAQNLTRLFVKALIQVCYYLQLKNCIGLKLIFGGSLCSFNQFFPISSFISGVDTCENSVMHVSRNHFNV